MQGKFSPLNKVKCYGTIQRSTPLAATDTAKTSDYISMGMPIGITPPGTIQHVLWCQRLYQLGTRTSMAAMMSRHQQGDRQRHLKQQPTLYLTAYVTGNQQSLATCRHLQHTRTVVTGELRRLLWRPEHAINNTVPLPLLTALTRRKRHSDGVACRGQEATHVMLIQGRNTARMVKVGMTDQYVIKALARWPQHAQRHESRGKTGPCIIEQAIVGTTQLDKLPLADIMEVDFKRTRPRS